MKTETIVMCVVALILGMLMFHMLKNVCGCKNVEGAESKTIDTLEQLMQAVNSPGGWLPTPAGFPRHNRIPGWPGWQPRARAGPQGELVRS